MRNFGGVPGGGHRLATGYDDVIVGAVEQDNGQFDEGRAYVYSGSSTGLAPVRISVCDETGP